MFKTDALNVCDKCGKDVLLGDSFSAIDPKTRQYKDYCYPDCVPERMSNCGYCGAMRRDDELNGHDTCIAGCIVFTAVPEQGFAPAKTLKDVRMLAAIGADICKHAAKYLKEQSGERQSAVSLLHVQASVLIGTLLFCIDAENFGEAK